MGIIIISLLYVFSIYIIKILQIDHTTRNVLAGKNVRKVYILIQLVSNTGKSI